MNAISGYTDASLTAAGGDADGKLDFYMAHYYGWIGTPQSPFVKPYAGWSLDKPLVIGEYPSSDWSPGMASSSPTIDGGAKVDTLMAYLDRTGYAGGMGWQYQPDVGDPWLKGFETFGHSLRQAYLADSNSIKVDGMGNGAFSVSVAATPGGSVLTNPKGRIDSGKTVTVQAIAATGYTFIGWSGDTTSINPNLTLASVIRDWMLVANFKPDAGTNLLKDGDFTTNSNWTLYAATGNTATAGYSNGMATIQIGAVDDTIYHVQLSQSGIPVDSGATYILSFDASSTNARTLNFGFSSGAPDWVWLGGSTAALAAATKSFHVEIKALHSSKSATLQLNLGALSGTVTLDNMSVVKNASMAIRPSLQADRISFRTTANGFEWIRTATLSEAATIRVVDVNGSELYRSMAKAGSRSGFIPKTGSGLGFLVIESNGQREVYPLAGVR